MIGKGGEISTHVSVLFGHEECGFSWVCTEELWVSTSVLVFYLSVPAAGEGKLGIILSPPAPPGRDGLSCGAQVSSRASGESASHSSFSSGEDVMNP